MQRLKVQQHPSAEVNVMHYLLNNLKAFDAQLEASESEQAVVVSGPQHDQALSSEELSGWSEIRLRLSHHMSPESPRFRHAVRLSLLLGNGYAVYN